MRDQGTDTHRRELRIAELARRQHGVVTHSQLSSLGLSGSAIGRRVAAGRLVRLHRAVYAVGHAALRPEAERLAAVLACGPGAVLSHASAAEHHGLLASAASWHDVTVARDTPIRQRWIRVHRTRALDATEVTTDGPLRVTTMARTALDLAETGRPDRVRRLIREGEIRRVIDVRELRHVIALNPFRAGAARLRDILADLPGDEPNEGFEERFLAFVVARGLPRPEVHAALGPYEADFYWREQAVVVETNDYASHAIRSSFEHEYERGAWFAARHIAVVPVTSRRLERDPDGVETDLRGALGVAPADQPVYGRPSP